MTLNTQLFFDINSLAGKNHVLDMAMIFCAKYLIYIIFALTATLVAYLLYRRDFRSALWFVGSLAVSFGLLQLAAHLYVDHRPFVDHHVTQLVSHAAGKSFPSDHTTVAAAIAFGLLFLTRFKKTGWALLIAAALVGFARVFVGIHYPIDILGGLVTGFAGAGLTWTLSRIITPRSSKTVAFDDHAGFSQ